MHIWLHKIEVLVDKLIAPVLAALLIVIIGELFFSHQFEWYKHYADWFDGFVVLVFAADLGFKYYRVRKLPTFLKNNWLEIIATIPFFLAFRLLELLQVTAVVEKGQAIAHEALAAGKVEREAAMIVKEAASAQEISRTAKMINTFRAVSRFPRFLRAAPFYEKPTGKHHWHEKKRRVA
ncbi:hypothetical protein HYU20_00115 [Candidatus Woesearchaeota archaeon]|nr:hypothetical protein [Candidatus Woesearchaeota archaeon]